MGAARAFVITLVVFLAAAMALASVTPDEEAGPAESVGSGAGGGADDDAGGDANATAPGESGGDAGTDANNGTGAST